MAFLNKYIKRISITLMTGMIIVSTGANSYALRQHNLDKPDIDIPSIIALDEKTGDVLYSRNENEQRPIASLTKSMTLLLTLEAIDDGRISEDDVVYLDKTPDAWGSRFYLKEGDSYTVRDLMDMIMIISANDACVVMGEYIDGSVDAFVSRMNKRAKELGMEKTTFKNPHGLPLGMEAGADPGNLSTAKDLALLVKYTMNNYRDTVSKIVSSEELDLKGMDAVRYNSNKLLFRQKNYDGYAVNGYKTGFTDLAKHCLITTSTHYNDTPNDSSDDYNIIGVSLGGATREYRYDEHTKLLNALQDNYVNAKLATSTKPVGTFNEYTKDEYKVSLLPQRDLDVLVNKSDLTSKGEVNYDKQIKLNKNIEYPIKKGDVLGTVTFTHPKNKDLSYTVNVVSDKDTPDVSFFDNMFRKDKSDK